MYVCMYVSRFPVLIKECYSINNEFDFDNEFSSSDLYADTLSKASPAPLVFESLRKTSLLQK